MNLEIRMATPEDAAQIARVDVDSHVAAYAHIFDVSRFAPNFASFVERWTRITSGDAPPGAPENVLVAVVEMLIEGYVVYGASRDEDGDGVGEIGALYVHPNRWRGGIGAALLSAAGRNLLDLEFKEATLWVIGANSQGRNFYEKQGWRPDGAERTAHDRLELRYRKRLA
jgi:GNAT superfamily N-acetyltransferase